MTTARYNQPRHVRMQVLSVPRALFRSVAVNSRCRKFGIAADRLPADQCRTR